MCKCPQLRGRRRENTQGSATVSDVWFQPFQITPVEQRAVLQGVLTFTCITHTGSMPPCLVGTPAYHQNSQSKAGRSIGGFIPTKWAFGVKWWQTPNSRSECGYWSSSHWNVDNVTDFNWVAIGIFDIWKCLIWIILWYPSFYFLERWSPQRNGTSWSLSLTLLTSKGLSCCTAATSTLNAVFFFLFYFCVLQQRVGRTWVSEQQGHGPSPAVDCRNDN